MREDSAMTPQNNWMVRTVGILDWLEAHPEATEAEAMAEFNLTREQLNLAIIAAQMRGMAKGRTPTV